MTREEILKILNKHKTEIWGNNSPDREFIDVEDFDKVIEDLLTLEKELR